MVELVLLEIKTAHQRTDGPITRIERHEGTLDLRQLGDFPGIFRGFDHADQCAATDLDVGARLVGQTRLRGLEAFAGDFKRFAVRAHGANPLGAGFKHHGRHHVAVVRVVGQRIVNRIFRFLGIGGKVDEFLRPPIDLPALVVHDAFAQGLVGHGLVGGAQGGVNIQAAGVGFVAVLVVDQLAHSFGHIFGMDPAGVWPVSYIEFFLFGRLGLIAGDEAVFLHALNDVQLTDFCPLRIDDGVVGRGCFRQAGQHGCLGNRDVLERLAKVSLRSGGKSVSPVPQKNLVHVDLKNLVFGQQMLKLEGQQDFIDLAGIAFLGRQVDIAGHLHGDGGRALAFRPAQIGPTRTQHAQIIDAAM